MKWIMFGIAISFNALGNILIKVGARGKSAEMNPKFLIELIITPWIIGGILFFILALAAYSYILSKVNPSVAYPLMTSMGFIVVTLAS